MSILLFFVALSICIVSILPFTKQKHWMVYDLHFIRVQLLLLSIILLFFTLVLGGQILSITLLLLLLTVVINGYFVFPYYIPRKAFFKTSSDTIKIMSFNVLQKNTNYNTTLTTIKKVDPDIVLLMEISKEWSEALSELNRLYPYRIHRPQENMYGICLYSKYSLKDSITHNFLSEEYPCIETKIILKDSKILHFFGFHPAPAVPTEKDTAHSEEAHSFILAKKIEQISGSVIVCGDFNTVGWTPAGKNFEEITGLVDARKGRGLYASFPSWAGSFGIPIDLLYHSKDIKIVSLKTLENIGSDHLPIFFEVQV